MVKKIFEDGMLTQTEKEKAAKHAVEVESLRFSFFFSYFSFFFSYFSFFFSHCIKRKFFYLTTLNKSYLEITKAQNYWNFVTFLHNFDIDLF
ncbi:MAG: hypothetical protein ACTSQC_10945 [Candidatus Heimdallarchaeaceae archaeon]